MTIRALLLVLALMGLAGGVQAQQVPPADAAAIRDVIGRQLDALQRDDAPAAFAFASPGIQGQFGTPDRFLDMVSRSYPSVHHPRSVEYTGLEYSDGRIVQQVELVGPDGQPHLALYEMERYGDGWRIAGCVLVPSRRVGT